MKENLYSHLSVQDQFGPDLKMKLMKELHLWTSWLAQYGATPNNGVTRLLYDSSWIEAHQALKDRMESLGLRVRTDRVGNLYGRLQGCLPAAGAIAVGSHLDTVKNGGRYDGAYGIVGAIIAIHTLQELFGPPLRSLEAVVFCEEEGSRFPLAYWGSGSVAGVRTEDDIIGLRDAAWISFSEAMAAAGYGLEGQPSPKEVDWTAFLELHIEQGPVLESEGLSLGIVDRIVGQRRVGYKLTGVANHAGTTPMGSRRDALAGAGEMMVALEELAASYGGPLTATIGRIEASPNTANVIPGEVRFTVDIRHPESAILNRFYREMEVRFRRISNRRQLEISSSVWVHTAPVPMDEYLSEMLERTAAARGLPTKRMPSGAGHDAQMIQAICPTALMFVPSCGGISHSPEEYTDPEDLAQGVLVLIDMLYKMAYVEAGEGTGGGGRLEV